MLGSTLALILIFPQWQFPFTFIGSDMLIAFLSSSDELAYERSVMFDYSTYF